MAIIDNRGRLHGRVGNTVYRTVGNTSIVQIKPSRVKQTLSTKESAMEFGLASNCGRILREIYATFASNSDGRMINRLNAVLLKCIKDSERERGERDLHDGHPGHLQGFQFNAHSPLEEALAVSPVCTMESARIRVNLPEFKENGQLQQVRFGRRCVLRMMLVAVNFRENYYEYLSYKDIAIDRGETIPGQDWMPEVALPAGSMVLASVSLHYFGLKDVAGDAQQINSKEFSPAEIIGVFAITDVEPSVAENVATDENRRHPLSNYYGQEILKEIARKRKRDKGYQARLKQKEQVGTNGKSAVTPDLPMGKVFYRKE
jgi:hypothetical protein